MPKKVTIHWAYPDAIRWDNSSVLSREERRKANAFRFKKHRTLYLASHHFLRQVLSHYGPLKASEWQYAYNDFGKPSISNAISEPLFFNLSHTDGMIVCAISKTHEVGIDVERCRPIENFSDLCAYCLHERERHALSDHHSPSEQTRLFFTYWTLKEACIKAWGKGFTISPQCFFVTNDTREQWKAQFTAMSNVECGLELRALPMTEHYQMAVAVQSSAAHCSSSHSLTVEITDSNSADRACWNSTVLTSEKG